MADDHRPKSIPVTGGACPGLSHSPQSRPSRYFSALVLAAHEGERFSAVAELDVFQMRDPKRESRRRTSAFKSRLAVSVYRQSKTEDGTVGRAGGRPQSAPMGFDDRAANR